MRTVTTDVLLPLTKEEVDPTLYTFGPDVAPWLPGAAKRPEISYLAPIPVFFPLIGLTQLVQYLAVCHVANLILGQLRDCLAGATGHSQSIVFAIVVATLSTFSNFAEDSSKALIWLFYGWQSFPITALEPGMVQDSRRRG